jgi:hypothetical protein
MAVCPAHDSLQHEVQTIQTDREWGLEPTHDGRFHVVELDPQMADRGGSHVATIDRRTGVASALAATRGAWMPDDRLSVAAGGHANSTRSAQAATARRGAEWSRLTSGPTDVQGKNDAAPDVGQVLPVGCRSQILAKRDVWQVLKKLLLDRGSDALLARQVRSIKPGVP